MNELPSWPSGTVAVLSTGAGDPHAIPVSTAVRRGPRELAFALSLRRESLVRLRADPRCAFTLLYADVSVTVLGRAFVEAELERVAVLRLEVAEIQDHAHPTFAIDEGVRWHWTDADAARIDAELRASL